MGNEALHCLRQCRMAAAARRQIEGHVEAVAAGEIVFGSVLGEDVDIAGRRQSHHRDERRHRRGVGT